jgi:hypothetical protein
MYVAALSLWLTTLCAAGATRSNGLEMPRGNRPAPPAPAAQAKEPGTVVGTCRTRSGKPIEGADVKLVGLVEGGQEFVGHAATDERGAYVYRAPAPGLYRFLEPQLALTVGGREYQFPLAPAGAGGDATFFDRRDYLPLGKGVVQDFVLPVSGPRHPNPGGANEPGGYYGFSLTIVPSPDVAGHTLEVTLAPVGPLIDGSPAKTLSFRHAIPAPVPSSYRFVAYDIPLGRYRMTRRLLDPSGNEVPFRLSTEGIFRGLTIPGLPRECVVGPGSVELKNFTDDEARRFNVTVTGDQD